MRVVTSQGSSGFTPEICHRPATLGPMVEGKLKWRQHFVKLNFLLEKKALRQSLLQKKSHSTKMLKTTKNDVVPMPGLVWHRMSSLRWKKEKNIRSTLCLTKQELDNNICTTKKIAHEKTM